MTDYNIAEFNVARARYELHHEAMKDFMDNRDYINSLATKSKGYVWHQEDDSEDEAGIRTYDDPLIVVNMSVWESLEDLYEYAYRGDHQSFFTRRSEWFHKSDEATMVLWWVPKGKIPTPEDGMRKLETLRAQGPSQEAFSMRKRFPKPESD